MKMPTAIRNSRSKTIEGIVILATEAERRLLWRRTIRMAGAVLFSRRKNGATCTRSLFNEDNADMLEDAEEMKVKHPVSDENSQHEDKRVDTVYDCGNLLSESVGNVLEKGKGKGVQGKAFATSGLA